LFNRKQIITQLLEFPQKGIILDIFYYDYTPNVDDDEINFLKNTLLFVSNHSANDHITTSRKQLLMDVVKNQERVDAVIR